MLEAKRKKLTAQGWQLGGTKDFLGLSAAESEFIELRLRLARSLRERRLQRGMGQVQVAKLIHSSQSRVAKMEAADPSVSVDLLVKSHLALGATGQELGRILARG